MSMQELLLQQPTIEGKVEGIIGVDPLVLQCRDCGAIAEQRPGRRAGAFVVLSGFHFHICEGVAGIRRCPSCLHRAKSECPSGRCKS